MMKRITGVVKLADGTDVEIADHYLKSKRRAVRYAKRLKKRGMWIQFEAGMFRIEEFIFPDHIDEIILKYHPIEIPTLAEQEWQE